MGSTLFLPGAGGSALFWRAASDRLTVEGTRRLLSWPGLGNEPSHPEINGIDDLVEMVLAELSSPSDLVAQSMGGVVAVKAALASPERVRRLVLVATSAGIPMEGAHNWRGEYGAAFPKAAPWILDEVEDLSAKIPEIKVPTLLIWGDRDPISPVRVGEQLRSLLPNSRLVIIPGGDHDLAVEHAAVVAPLIDEHLW